MEGSMATMRKRGDKWHVQIRRLGHSQTRSFTHKTDAHAWVRMVEREIDRGEFSPAAVYNCRITVEDLLHRYQREVSTKKKGGAIESYRLNTVGKYFPVSLTLAQVNSSHVAQYRDRRLRLVRSGTIHREL
jgi:hypothetical protein